MAGNSAVQSKMFGAFGNAIRGSMLKSRGRADLLPKGARAEQAIGRGARGTILRSVPRSLPPTCLSRPARRTPTRRDESREYLTGNRESWHLRPIRSLFVDLVRRSITSAAWRRVPASRTERQGRADVTFNVRDRGRKDVEQTARDRMLVRKANRRREQACRVASSRLDSFFPPESFGRCAVWMDVEGASREVLTGAVGMSCTRSTSMFVEVEDREAWEGQWLSKRRAGFPTEPRHHSDRPGLPVDAPAQHPLSEAIGPGERSDQGPRLQGLAAAKQGCERNTAPAKTRPARSSRPPAPTGTAASSSARRRRDTGTTAVRPRGGTPRAGSRGSPRRSRCPSSGAGGWRAAARRAGRRASCAGGRRGRCTRHRSDQSAPAPNRSSNRSPRPVTCARRTAISGVPTFATFHSRSGDMCRPKRLRGTPRLVERHAADAAQPRIAGEELAERRVVLAEELDVVVGEEHDVAVDARRAPRCGCAPRRAPRRAPPGCPAAAPDGPRASSDASSACWTKTW